MNWIEEEPVRGDIIRVKLGVIYHYGIFLSKDEIVQFGYPPVGPKSKEEKRVCLTVMAGFSLDNPIERGVPSPNDEKTRLPKEECISKALSRLGEGGYNVLHNNCEHFANECYFGRHFSFQEEFLRTWWLSKSKFDVYFAEISEIEGPFYPKERDEEIARAKDKTLKMQKGSSWNLLFLALRHSLGIDPAEYSFVKNEYGKWTCPDFYFSLSHSGNLVMVGVSGMPIGVDLESEEKFSKLWASPQKLSSLREKLGGQEEEDLLSLWVKKESCFKAYGEKYFNPASPLLDKPHSLGEYRGFRYCVYGDLATKRNFYQYEDGKFVPASIKEMP